MKSALAPLAAATLVLMISLSAFTPVFAITSTVITDEPSANGAGDTFVESEGAPPAYADYVVDGILQTPQTETTVIVVTQEVAAEEPAPAAEEPAPAAEEPAPAAPLRTPPAPEPVVTQAPTASPAPEPAPADDAANPIPVGDDTQQVLGVSMTAPAPSAEYYALDKRLDSMEQAHHGMNGLIFIAALILAAVIPLQVFILAVQYRMEAAILSLRRSRKLKKKT